ncbi:MAG: FtsX-like permease family protein [Planctomycetales bacterium]
MYKLLLCTRYLRTRYIALASIISVMLGVATMIVVNSVMSGFTTQMKDRLHGILADMVVESTSLRGVPDPERDMERIRQVAGEYIVAMSPTVESFGMMTFRYRGENITRPISLIGIDAPSKAKVSRLVEDLGSYQPETEDGKVIRPALRTMDVPPNWELSAEAMAERRENAKQEMEELPHNPPPEKTEDKSADKKEAAGTNVADDPFTAEAQKDRKPLTLDELAAPRPGRLILGIGLISFDHLDRETGKNKTFMMVSPGSDVKITTVNASQEQPTPVSFDATYVDFFRSGMSEYDSSLAFCDIKFLQDVRGMSGMDANGKEQRYYSTIQIKLKDFKYAKEVEQRLMRIFPPAFYSVKTWEEKQGPLLAAVAVESSILNVLLFLIIAVAGFGILAIFFMIVVEKTRDIGILKALGASSSGVLTIFLSYGLALGLVGSGVGVVLGLLFVWNINWIESWISFLTGCKVFDRRIYYFPEIPTHIEPMMVVWVALGAISIAVIASILPARRAASLHPVKSLRYE